MKRPRNDTRYVYLYYSIFCQARQGRNKIIFVIRKDIEKDFREVIGNRIETVCTAKGISVAYAFQALAALPQGITLPKGRTKPWGTGQAVLSCKEYIQEPFAVINADDYYGKEAFRKIYEFLQSYSPAEPNRFCMAGFILKNTLSENGVVTRGICTVNNDGYLTDITETPNIVKNADGSVSTNHCPIDLNAHVSMNMWGLTPEFMEMLEQGFIEFFSYIDGNELTAEYLLPIYIGELLRKDQISVKVLETPDQWFGITYQEDKPAVAAAFDRLIQAGVYHSPLYG